MKYPFIVTIESHNRHEDQAVVLGRENERLDGFFTRLMRVDTGAQFWGHYRMTLKEAVVDFEARKNS